MSFAAFLAAVIAAVLAVFDVHPDVTLPLAVAFIAAGLLYTAVFGLTPLRRGA